MAVLSALLSYLTRQLGSLVQAVFGWAVTAIFGRLPSKQQTAVTAALLASIMWPAFVVGLFFPGVAAWLVAFVPLHKWVSPSVLRVVWCVLAVGTPPAVGLVTRWASRSTRGGIAWAALNGYPLALGFFLSFLVTVVTVPIVQIASIVRRWSDEHVYVQPRPDRYDATMHRLAEACVAAGITPEVGDAPKWMAISTKVLRALARGAIGPIVRDDPKRIRAQGIELYLYPADLLLRGEAVKVNHVRAMLARASLERDAYIVESPRAQALQDDLLAEPGRVLQIGRDIDAADIPFEDWVMLDRIRARTMHGIPLERVMQTHPPHSTASLIKEGMDEAKALLRVEIALAKDEARAELKQVEGAAIGFGIAILCVVSVLVMMAVAGVLAAGATPAAALVAAACFAGVALIAGFVGYSVLPKKPLEETRHRLETDVHEIKEHVL